MKKLMFIVLTVLYWNSSAIILLHVTKFRKTPLSVVWFMIIHYILKKHVIHSGFIPPESFPYLDSLGYLQDDSNVPILYHIIRRSITILHQPHLNSNTDSSLYLYSKSISNRDSKDNHLKNVKKYYWLNWLKIDILFFFSR